jgi:hypothetical protein
MPLINDSDYEFIKNIKSNDSKTKIKAENALFTKYEYLVKQAVFKHKISEDDAFTAYSKAFCEAIRNIESESFRGDSSFKTYFNAIFNRRTLDILNYNQTKAIYHTINIEEVFDSQETIKIIHSIDEKIDYEFLRQQIKNLGEPCHTVLSMWANRYTHQEITTFVMQAFGISIRVDDKLKSCLTKLEYLKKYFKK